MNKLKNINFNEHYPHFGLLLLAENILYLLWGPMINYLFPNYVDPLWIRVLSMIIYGAVVFFRDSNFIKQNRHFFVLSFMFMFMIHLCALGLINGDPVLYNTILIPGAIIMGTITYDLRPVILWCLTAIALMTYTVVVSFSHNSFIILAYLITASIVAIVICINRRSLFFLLMKKNEELSEQRALAIHSTKMSTIGEIASGVAHEINNPLAIINGHVDKLNKGIERNLETAEVKKSLHKIKKAVHRAKNIVDALGNFTINATSEESEKTSVNFAMKETIALGRTRIHSSGVQLDVKTLEVDEFVNVNLVDLSQVILNLLINSYDAVIDTEKPWIRLSIEKDEKNIFIVITDSGKEISEEVVGKMMIPFFTTKANHLGTGLGLSTSVNIIEKYKGTLEYVPLNGNTSFRITLPKL